MHADGDYLIDQLADWAPVVAKRMFGGLGFYRDGLMFSLMIEDVIYFKVDDTTRADYEAAGSKPFTYEARGKLVTVAYWQIPDMLMDDAEQLCAWATKAYEVALRGKQKKALPSKKR